MGAKRALIVDDSKSARLFLARALERYDIDVDSAESAEAAIAYLASNRPDVIFMDHLMPGMDGLQAVKAIKNDPHTASIPIMMYTSQEGELYLGQARALGAVGVLPKQIKPTDVSKILYQLHLVPERRSSEQSTFRPAGEPAAPAAHSAPSRPLTESELREHFAELRRALVAGIDTQTERITAEVRALLFESLPPSANRRPPGNQPWPWIVACAALALALGSTALWWRSVRALDSLTVEVGQLHAQAARAGTPGSRAPAPAAAPSPAAAETRPIILPVPYGSEALGGARLEAIGRLLARLTRQKVAGVVEVRTYAGRFCLVGNAADGYSLPPEEMPFAKCDIVGNPAEDTLSPTQRMPLALANLIGATRVATNGTLDVQVSVGDAANLLTPYPQVAGELSAGEWNRVAGANNRVEVRLH
ncbi:MAG: response regulator [Steroidobacteraceae bacterium]